MNSNIIIAFILMIVFMGIAFFIIRIFDRKSNLVRKQLRSIQKEKKSNIAKEDLERTRRELKIDFKVSNKFRKDLIVAGVKLKPEEFITMWILVVIVPLVFSIILRLNFLLMLVILVSSVIGPPVYVMMSRKKRFEMYSKQLGESLSIVANSLRAGFTFEQSLITIINDVPDPISSEFNQVVKELSLGSSLEDSLNALAKRMDSKDTELLTTAVTIQKQVGGNLSDIMDTIAQTIRERVEMKMKIQVLTAQGRISGLVIGLLPVGLVGAISLINPEYMMPLFTTVFGYFILGISFTLEAIGMLLIMKIVNIKMD